MTARSCCLCGRSGQLTRYRYAEIKGGPAQWRCSDERGCTVRMADQPNG